MTGEEPSLAVKRDLYDVMSHVKELAPWDWMEETDIFGVQHLETGEMGFVSVMGMLGQHYAVALYLGSEGLYGFWHVQDAGPTLDPRAILEVPQLQASYEDRRMVEEQDRAVLKQLGLKFRGPNAWPIFRSYRPGFYPWYLEADEAALLLVALQQLLDVAPRFKQKRRLLYPPGEGTLLVRAAYREGEVVTWEDKVIAVPPPQEITIETPMDTRKLESLRQKSQRNMTLEVDLMMHSIPIQEKKGERPYFAYLLLMVDAESGFVFGVELLQPRPSLHHMWGLLPMTFVKQLGPIGALPSEARVRSPLLSGLLRPVADHLGFRLVEVYELPALDAAKASFDEFLGRERF